MLGAKEMDWLLQFGQPVDVDTILDEEHGVYFTECAGNGCGTACPICGECHHICRCYDSYYEGSKYGNPSDEELLELQGEDAAFEESTKRSRRMKRGARAPNSHTPREWL